VLSLWVFHVAYWLVNINSALKRCFSFCFRALSPKPHDLLTRILLRLDTARCSSSPCSSRLGYCVQVELCSTHLLRLLFAHIFSDSKFTLTAFASVLIYTSLHALVRFFSPTLLKTLLPLFALDRLAIFNFPLMQLPVVGCSSANSMASAQTDSPPFASEFLLCALNAAAPASDCLRSPHIHSASPLSSPTHCCRCLGVISLAAGCDNTFRAAGAGASDGEARRRVGGRAYISVADQFGDVESIFRF
jgi:hypothetical protein